MRFWDWIVGARLILGLTTALFFTYGEDETEADIEYGPQVQSDIGVCYEGDRLSIKSETQLDQYAGQEQYAIALSPYDCLDSREGPFYVQH